jgi:hypothetical protein
MPKTSLFCDLKGVSIGTCESEAFKLFFGLFNAEGVEFLGKEIRNSFFGLFGFCSGKVSKFIRFFGVKKLS